MGLTPLTFTGISSFSSDFQTILQRSLSIAEIPLQILQNKDSDILQQKTLLGSMNSVVADLGSSLTSLGEIATNQALAASSSDSSVVSVTNTGASAPTQYTINEITSLAKPATETSLQSYADSSSTPVSSTGTVELTVGSQSYQFTLSQNNLLGLRDAINAQGAGVTATILTTGSGNYLSVSANSPGTTTLALKDDPEGANTDLLTTTIDPVSGMQGSNAVFKLNGISISRSSNTVNDVIPGVTFNLLDTTSSPVRVTLASDRTQLASALQDFATKYNAVVDAVNQQVGQSAGLLSGDYIVRQIQQDLRQVGSYTTTSGTVRSLADLGIEFDDTGKMSLNQDTFNNLSDTQISDAFSFLGSATTGLASLASNFTQLSDPIDGLIKLQQDGYDQTDQQLQKQISDLTDRINATQQSTSAKLQAADALLAELESQQSMVDASVQGLNYVAFGKNTGTTGQ